MQERKVEKGLRLREGVFESRSGATMGARDLLATASYLNFLHWVAPGGFCHLRSGWDVADEAGVMVSWRSGAKRAAAVAAMSENLRNDMVWRLKMLSPRPVKRLQFSESGRFARHARLPNLRELAMSLVASSVVTVYTYATSIRGWGATSGDRFIQGK